MLTSEFILKCVLYLTLTILLFSVLILIYLGDLPVSICPVSEAWERWETIELFTKGLTHLTLKCLSVEAISSRTEMFQFELWSSINLHWLPGDVLGGTDVWGHFYITIKHVAAKSWGESPPGGFWVFVFHSAYFSCLTPLSAVMPEIISSIRPLQALDGHKSSGDSGSRRDSSSEIFADSSKEGFLNFRQLNTDKNKVNLSSPAFL